MERFRFVMCRAPAGQDARFYHRRVDRLPPGELLRIGRSVLPAMDDDELVRETKRLLRDAVDAVLFTPRLDVAVVEVRGRPFLVSGGLAEDGVGPTEAFGYLRLLDESGITVLRREPPDGGRGWKDLSPEPEMVIGQVRRALERDDG